MSVVPQNLRGRRLSQSNVAASDADGEARLRVALVSTQRTWHGGEEQGALLARGLVQRGHECVILARRGSEFATRLADEGFEVVTFTGRGRSPAALWQLRRTIRRRQIDVVHYNDAHALLAAGVATLGLRLNARIASRRVVFPVRRAAPYRWLADEVLCVSRKTAENCRQSGIPADRVRVVYDGVDPQRVARGDRQRGRSALQLQPQHRLLLCVATLGEHKGQQYLLEALPAVVREQPNLRVALAGDGPLRHSLQQQIERLNLQAVVQLLGYRTDVPDLLHAADLFVMPSIVEGLGSSLIDAMLAGVPIVTTTAGGIPELVGPLADDPQPVAALVPPAEPKRLASAIAMALRDPAFAASLADRARHRALARFTAHQMVEATLAAYGAVGGG